MKYIKLWMAGLIIALFISACSDSKDDDKKNPTGPATQGDFAVTVSSGTTPNYSWSAGNVFSVSVVRTADPTVIVWGIATPGQANIASPAKHGVVPTGAIETAQTEKALTAGVEYRVSVTKLDGKTGWKDFTP
ncbi:MAG: hypothetical protein WAN36_04165 [Calditrichia bacterium]